MGDWDAWISMASGVLGLLLYVVRAELRGEVARVDGRINAHETGCAVRQHAIECRLQALDDRAARMEHKLDRALDEPR